MVGCEGQGKGAARRSQGFVPRRRGAGCFLNRNEGVHPGRPTSYGRGDNLPYIHIELEAKVGHPNGPIDWGAGERREMCKSEGEAVTRRRWEGFRCHRSQVG